ncbi:hypothetical protein L1987_47294 [Smallanthus sonchifolius]|uniref:Uncharacterized protein n=1 Tax=Smallanthus sonchifolius TaxID=185202 RepID=A0ACB9G1T5_9ASTR|nr:hypothetical protein L1987_47294 [Smallanthus sonchifolius]
MPSPPPKVNLFFHRHLHSHIEINTTTESEGYGPSDILLARSTNLQVRFHSGRSTPTAACAQSPALDSVVVELRYSPKCFQKVCLFFVLCGSICKVGWGVVGGVGVAKIQLIGLYLYIKIIGDNKHFYISCVLSFILLLVNLLLKQAKKMESSSKIYGDRTEECQSSESGWTMYIGSSMDDDDDDGDHDDGGGGKKKGALKDEDEDTDDSMTSDASSGPSHLHLQQPWEVQQDETDGKHNQESYKSSSKKNKKASKKKKDGHEESRKKDESLVNEKRGVITTVQSGNRAWFLGKRK